MTLAAESLLNGELESICRRLIQEALSSNMQAVKMILDRILPIRRDRCVTLGIPILHTPADAIQSIYESYAVLLCTVMHSKMHSCAMTTPL